LVALLALGTRLNLSVADIACVTPTGVRGESLSVKQSSKEVVFQGLRERCSLAKLRPCRSRVSLGIDWEASEARRKERTRMTKIW